MVKQEVEGSYLNTLQPGCKAPSSDVNLPRPFPQLSINLRPGSRTGYRAEQVINRVQAESIPRTQCNKLTHTWRL